MREILYQAKRIDNGNWVEGTPFQEYSDFWGEWKWIIQTKHPLTNVPYLHLEVDRKTIRQFTGLTDANGEKIFEGDIVECAREDEPLKVEWCEDSARFILSANTFCCDFDNYWGYEVEVIGNIYDNPELLGG